MFKEVPEWLKNNYNRLWIRYGNQAFTFKDALKELGVSKAMTVKTFWELEQRGFVSKERSEVDYRKRVYRLISPDDVSFAIGLYSLVEKKKMDRQDVFEKLVLINDRLLYALTGSYAAYYYTHYMIPAKTFEIKIDTHDEGKWIAFLTDARTRVFIGDVMETKNVDNYVKLLHATKLIILIRTKTEEGYYIEKPEFLLIELLERQSQTSVIDAIAIILRKKNNLQWYSSNGVIHLAKNIGLSRKFGFLLDAINFEARESLIETKIIQEIKKDVVGKSDETFPKDEVFLLRFQDLRNKLMHQALLTENEVKKLESLKERFEGYKTLSEKWGIQSLLPRYVVRKVLEDFGVMS